MKRTFRPDSNEASLGMLPEEVTIQRIQQHTDSNGPNTNIWGNAKAKAKAEVVWATPAITEVGLSSSGHRQATTACVSLSFRSCFRFASVSFQFRFSFVSVSFQSRFSLVSVAFHQSCHLRFIKPCLAALTHDHHPTLLPGTILLPTLIPMLVPTLVPILLPILLHQVR